MIRGIQYFSAELKRKLMSFQGAALKLISSSCWQTSRNFTHYTLTNHSHFCFEFTFKIFCPNFLSGLFQLPLPMF